MKKVQLIALSIILIASAFTISTIWKVIDTEKIVINFKLDNEGTKGTFTGINAVIDFDFENLAESKIRATINVSSLSTENERRDDHLKNADFFDAEKFPTISFVSDEILKTETGFVAKGKLTMKEHTDMVDVPFTVESDKNGNTILKGGMKVSPYAYGVIKNEKSKNETVTVTFEIPLTK